MVNVTQAGVGHLDLNLRQSSTSLFRTAASKAKIMLPIFFEDIAHEEEKKNWIELGKLKQRSTNGFAPFTDLEQNAGSNINIYSIYNT